MTKERNYTAGTEQDRQTDLEAEKQRRNGESNLLEIKKGRAHGVKEKKREIMGDFILLLSLLSSVIRHQGTQSHWILSFLGQFHCSLSVSVTPSSVPSRI